MTNWILAAVAIYFFQSIAPSLLQFLLRKDPQFVSALGPRDNPPSMPLLGARFARALKNYQEALFMFLPIALLIEARGAHGEWSELGATIFVFARALYSPAYASGVFGLRSAIWLAGHIGIGMMAMQLLESL